MNIYADINKEKYIQQLVDNLFLFPLNKVVEIANFVNFLIWQMQNEGVSLSTIELLPEESSNLRASWRKSIESTALKAEKQKRHMEAFNQLLEKAKAFFEAMPPKEREKLKHQVLETITKRQREVVSYVDTKIINAILEEYFRKDVEYLARLHIEIVKR